MHWHDKKKILLNLVCTFLVKIVCILFFGQFSWKLTPVQECWGAFSTKLADVCGVLCGHAKTIAKEDDPGMEKLVWTT